MTDENSDPTFANRVLIRLPAEVPSPSFQAALLEAYDVWNARRPEGRWAALHAGLGHFSNAIWPGAPLWAPASAFALALVLGTGLGIALPPIANDEQPGFSLEQPANFSLNAVDATQEDM